MTAPASVITPELHPVIHLTDEELRRVLGGVDSQMVSSTMTGTYGDSYYMCCDGSKVCCCNC
jgi:hypothetical protein